MRKSTVILGVVLGTFVISLILLGQVGLSARFGSLNQTGATPFNLYDPAYYGLPPTLAGYKVFAVLTPDNTACMLPGEKRLVLQATQPNVEEFLRTNNNAMITKELEEKGLSEYDKWGIQIVGPGVVLEEFLAENTKSTEFRRKFGCVTSVPKSTFVPVQ
jgi:hypothetical protein